MKNSRSISHRFQDIIRAAHAYIENDPLFVKSETKDPIYGDFVEWFPTDFK